MRSGEHRAADGTVERWNPQVGRWEQTGTPVSIAQNLHVDARPNRQSIANAVRHANASWKTSQRMYAGARSSRQTVGFGSSGNSSADAEIGLSLTNLRARSRQMVRDSNYAKRAQLIVTNNVIGSGVGMQGQVETSRDGELFKRVNDDIEAAFSEWSCAENCHTGAGVHFADLERLAMDQVFEAGEVFIRLHRRKFGRSRVPLAIEIVESERVPHEVMPPGVEPGNEVRQGIEVDRFQRPVAYFIRARHPGDIRASADAVDYIERVPAEDVLHLRVLSRWPQTRGVPWLHTALLKLDQMNEVTLYEVQAARGAAAYFATITTPEEQSSGPNDEEEDTGAKVMDLEPLTVQELAPGEELQFHAPNRPNTALDAFIRFMVREVASGIPGVSYAGISCDYSQANYSSERVSQLDARDTWRVMQQWWVRSFRTPLHKAWLAQAVMARAIPSITPESYALDMARYEAVRFKPRGWQWVDPAKEVEAFKEARRAGFISTSDIIAQTAGGRDVEDVIDEIKRENELFEAAGIERDTDIPDEPVMRAPAAQPAAKPAAESEDDAPAGRAIRKVYP